MSEKEKIIASLVGLGLKENEAVLYRHLLEYSPASVAELQRRSGLHRPSIYRALRRLKSDGLIETVIRGKSTWYRPTSAQELTEFARKALRRFDESLAELQRLHTERERKIAPSVIFREGKEGIKAVYRDILETVPADGVYYRYNSSDVRKRSLCPKYMPSDFLEKRD